MKIVIENGSLIRNSLRKLMQYTYEWKLGMWRRAENRLRLTISLKNRKLASAGILTNSCTCSVVKMDVTLVL